MNYVLQRVNQDGGYVAVSGSDKSYTHDLTRAQTFLTREDALKNRCGNENVVPISSLLQPPRSS